MKKIVDLYFLCNQQYLLLKPLMEDKSIYSIWDHSEGTEGVSVLRLIMWQSLLSQIYGILFDQDNRSVSLSNVMKGLENENLACEARKIFCTPTGVTPIIIDGTKEDEDRIIKQVQQEDVKHKESVFDKTLSEIKEKYSKLIDSPLVERIKSLRDKIIAHSELKFSEEDGSRRLYNPRDFSASWRDIENLLEISPHIIFKANLLVTNSSYQVDSFVTHNENVARTFWSKVKG